MVVGYDVRLYEDGYGVRHWRYPMLGVLLLCGSSTSHGSNVYTNEAPTCIRCVAIMIREEYT